VAGACVASWLGPVVVAITGGVGAIIAIASIRASKKIARQKNAIDLLREYQGNDALRAGFNEVRLIYLASDKDARTFAHDDKQGTDEAKHLRDVLNYLEYVALGIELGIYDEETIKRLQFTTIMRAWRHTQDYVHKRRELKQQPTLYQELQALVQRRESDALKKRTDI
jgi:hypothetical protein